MTAGFVTAVVLISAGDDVILSPLDDTTKLLLLTSLPKRCIMKCNTHIEFPVDLFYIMDVSEEMVNE